MQMFEWREIGDEGVLPVPRDGDDLLLVKAPMFEDYPVFDLLVAAADPDGGFRWIHPMYLAVPNDDFWDAVQYYAQVRWVKP